MRATSDKQEFAVGDFDEVIHLGTKSGHDIYWDIPSNTIVEYAEVDPDENTDYTLIVGIVNYYGFQVAEYGNTIEDKTINRMYQGNSSGTESERISAATFDAVR